jgi:hypothetical protein
VFAFNCVRSAMLIKLSTRVAGQQRMLPLCHQVTTLQFSTKRPRSSPTSIPRRSVARTIPATSTSKWAVGPVLAAGTPIPVQMSKWMRRRSHRDGVPHNRSAGSTMPRLGTWIPIQDRSKMMGAQIQMQGWSSMRMAACSWLRQRMSFRRRGWELWVWGRHRHPNPISLGQVTPIWRDRIGIRPTHLCTPDGGPCPVTVPLCCPTPTGPSPPLPHFLGRAEFDRPIRAHPTHSPCLCRPRV